MVLSQLEKQVNRELILRELARRGDIKAFIKITFPNYHWGWFHEIYAEVLNLFILGIIKKLMVSAPPQHGKSEQATRRLIALFLGLNPNLKMALASYNQTRARKFSVEIQRIIAEKKYNNIFPKTTIASTPFSLPSETGVKAQRQKDEFEIINHLGGLKAVGRGGSLTGDPVDIGVIDDIFKDSAEANSPVIRDNAWDWYRDVWRSRLHNDSQELMVFTRWHEDDPQGLIEKKEKVINLKNRSQLEVIDEDAWYKINFPALSNTESLDNEFDLRNKIDIPLYPEKHSFKKLDEVRKLDSEAFESLYQGDPKPRVGLLYSGFNMWTILPKIIRRGCYVDVADTGTDFLCAIFYGLGIDENIYVNEVVYSSEPQEITENLIAEAMHRFKPDKSVFESNNGGRGFARMINKITDNKFAIETFHQTQNKESRIITNASEVQRRILFPLNWTNRWSAFSRDLMRFKKKFRANAHDDASDCLTGVAEHSGILENSNALWE